MDPRVKPAGDACVCKAPQGGGTRRAHHAAMPRVARTPRMRAAARSGSASKPAVSASRNSSARCKVERALSWPPTMVKAWSLEQLVEGCARAGLSAISPWRDVVQACGPERAGKLIRAHDMTVTGLCRGGMFPAADEASRRAAIDDNRRAIDEAAAIGAQCLVLVVGGLPKGSRDIVGARMQVRD